MFPISIGIRDFRRQADTLNHDVFRMASVLGSMRQPLTDSVHNVIIPSIGQNFVYEGRPRWRELNESTVRNRGSSHPILIHKGLLHRAALSKTSWRISDTEANMDGIDSKVPYAKFHQSGTRTMPRREFAVLQSRDVDAILGIFSDWINQTTTKHWS